MADDSGEDPADSVQDAARERQRERTESVESMLAPVEEAAQQLDYPTTSEAVAVEYGDQVIDLPNETETLGSVMDRLVDEEFDSPESVVEAVSGEITGEAHPGPAEYNDQRALDAIDGDDQP